MTDHTDPHIIGLFLLLHRLQRTGRPLGRDTIVPFAKIKLPRVAQMYVALIGRLLEEKLIEGDAERFTLCPNALDVIQDVSQKHSLHTLFYNVYYQAILHSRAHALFCERIYGKDLGNMAWRTCCKSMNW